MLKNPDHKVIKAMAVNLLQNMTTTPAQLQKVCPELMPIADYHNGLMRPNNKPPFSVRVELEGELWIYNLGDRKWRRRPC